MDSNGKPRPSRKERHPLFYPRRGLQKAACRPVDCYSNIVSNADLPINVYDDISFEDLHKGVRQSHEQLTLHLATEYSKRRHESQEKSWSDCRDELGELSTCIRTLKKQLKKFWSSAAEFSRGRTQCQGRYFSRRSSYLKQYLELVLDFKLSDYYLECDGKLDRALHGAQQFLSKSEVWFSDRPDFMPPLSSLQTAEDIVSVEYRIAQWRLQELSAYEELLAINFQNVKEQLQQLLSIEEALDEEQIQREVEQRQSDKYMERLERFIREVTIRLQIFLMLLFLFCKFSGISHNDQPMCISMPWNIRPALIVLWGVCWMFYTPQDYVDPTDTQDAEIDGHMDHSRIEWAQWTSDELFPISDLDLFSYDQDRIAQQPILRGATEVSTPFPEPSFCEYQDLDSEALKQIRCEEGPGRSAALDPKDALSSSNLTLYWESLPTFHMISDDHPRLANGQPEDLLAGPVSSASHVIDRLNTHVAQSTSPSRPRSGFEQPQQPVPYVPEGFMTCEHAQCSELMFDNLSDWKKHDDRVHNRQACDIPGCTQSFGSKGELYRHKQTKHNQIPPHKLLPCLESNCKYSLTPHFKRKDNLVNHLQRIHKYSPPDAKAKANSEVRSQGRSQLKLQTEPQSISFGTQISQAISTSVAIAKPTVENSPQQDRPHSIMPKSLKKRRLSKTASYPDEASDLSRESREESQDEEEPWKRKFARYEREMEALRAQNISLRTQNELLESKIQRLEDNQDSLIAVLAAARSS